MAPAHPGTTTWWRRLAADSTGRGETRDPRRCRGDHAIFHFLVVSLATQSPSASWRRRLPWAGRGVSWPVHRNHLASDHHARNTVGHQCRAGPPPWPSPVMTQRWSIWHCFAATSARPLHANGETNLEPWPMVTMMQRSHECHGTLMPDDQWRPLRNGAWPVRATSKTSQRHGHSRRSASTSPASASARASSRLNQRASGLSPGLGRGSTSSLRST